MIAHRGKDLFGKTPEPIGEFAPLRPTPARPGCGIPSFQLRTSEMDPKITEK
jgi:hypothetical protein